MQYQVTLKYCEFYPSLAESDRGASQTSPLAPSIAAWA